MNQDAQRSLRIFRIVLWAIILVIGVGASIFYLVSPPRSPIGSFGDDFTMSRVDGGGTFSRADLQGAASMVFFGYTYCPDVCPTTLVETTNWRETLGAYPEDLRIIFVTVDPARDTPELLTQYLSLFGDVIGLYGTDEQTENIKASFGVIANKIEDEGATEYLVEHTASVFLMDKRGEFVDTIAYGTDEPTAMRKLENLMRR